MRAVLGLGGSDHDVHACLVQDGRVVVGIEEERLSRKKYGLGGNLMDALARRYCLDHAGLSLDQVTIVADAILPPTAMMGCRKRARRIDHHLAHAATAWFTSGLDSGAIVVVDNAGGLVKDRDGEGLQATSWYAAEGRVIRLLGRVLSQNWHEGRLVAGQPYQRGDGDHSIGHLYKKVTGALGFAYRPAPVGRAPADDSFFFPEDGITMGLAPYGDERYVDELWSLVELREHGDYRICINDGRADSMLARWLADGADLEQHAACARAVQEVVTRVLCHVVEHAMDAAGTDALCLGGGVAMNCVANGDLLRRTRARTLYIPPMPGDNGTGYGAALWAATRDPRAPVPVYSVYAGRSYQAGDIAAALAVLDSEGFAIRELAEAELLAEVARLLARGMVVAWYQGGAEAGRRALGHRSIFADPRTVSSRERLNQQIKRRQWFRPFAPAVPAEHAAEYFACSQASPYMQIVFEVRPDKRALIPAVCHVDGTARVQTLSADRHPRLHALLHAFKAESGVPILLNTSFNGRGEPIVETPAQAVDCFVGNHLDALVLEQHLVLRR